MQGLATSPRKLRHLVSAWRWANSIQAPAWRAPPLQGLLVWSIVAATNATVSGMAGGRQRRRMSTRGPLSAYTITCAGLILAPWLQGACKWQALLCGHCPAGPAGLFSKKEDWRGSMGGFSQFDCSPHPPSCQVWPGRRVRWGPPRKWGSGLWGRRAS